MIAFLMSLVSPEALLFAERVEQVDLPGTEGDFGILAGHAPIVARLRPGVVTVIRGDSRERFVVLGGVAEFSNDQLTILADASSAFAEFDVAELQVRIEQVQQSLKETSLGEELDRAITLLDHYKSLEISLRQTSAF